MQSMTLSNTTTTTSAARPNVTNRTGKRTITRTSAVLWTIQGALALTFAFAGLTKLADPGAAADSASLPVAFMAFIGVCEVLGAAALILPGVTRIRQGLTPLAAAGLVVIMIGATIVTAIETGVGPAVMPLLVGVFAAFIAYRRTPDSFGLAPRS